MKKGILFFTFLLIGTFIIFGFQDSMKTFKSNTVTEKYIDTKNDFNYSKCGEGSAAEATPAKKECSDKEKAKCSSASSGCTLKSQDKDADGKVSADEFKKHFTEEFAKCDKNTDGKVTSEECHAFDKFNSDKNEVMTAEEFVSGHEKMFAEMDKDKDGFLNEEEYKSCCASNAGDAKCAVSAKSDKKEGCSKEEKAKCAKDAKAEGTSAKKCGGGKCCGGGKADNTEKK
ncbi:MAG: hypothetical protein IPH57_11160 [Saprospiraceae bacterium]|nr:hypothetical protein [Saprospiraceae bacterium]